MQKNLILLVALLLCRNLLPAQNLSAYVTGQIGSTTFAWPCTGAEDPPEPPGPTSCQIKERQIKTEYPPYIIGGGWRTYFFTDGGESSIASHPNSIVPFNELNFKDNGSAPTMITNKGNHTWSLNYYSVYSAQYINHPTAGTVSMAFTEGENYHQPSTGPSSPCSWMEGSAATTYLCVTWTPNTLATNWGHQFFTDLGPIIWPAAGYFLPNGQKSSVGCANDATIQADDGYLYVFYKDQSCGDIGAQMGPGRQPGIRVARAPVSDALNPHAYQTFYEDGSGIHWNQSLPAGFNKDNIGSYLSSIGPQGSKIVGIGSESDRDYTRFAVAKVAGTNYYMGLGSYQQNGYIVVTLKYSYDLLHWSGDREIYRSGTHAANQFSYPIFLNANGWTNTTIDENDFYVIGTNPERAGGINKVVYKMRLQIPPPEHPGVPIACNFYMYIGADASGATLGDIDITGDKLTIEAVFNRTEDYVAATAGGDLVSKHCNPWDVNYFLRPGSAGITTTDGYFQVDLPCDYERYTTNHAAMVYDGAQLSLYRNGILEASVPATGNLITNDYQTTIGTEACSNNWGTPIHFQGYITEVRIWKKARTQQKIQEYKNVTIGFPILDPDLLGYYTFYDNANRGSFGGVASTFNNANVFQTNPNCIQDTYGCFSLARKGNGTAKGIVNTQAPSVSSATVSSAATNVVVYPNPARNLATMIYSSNATGILTIDVIDMTGKKAMVMKRPVIKGSNTINIDLNNLSRGVYSVQLFDGNKTLTKKLVISK